MTLIIRRKKKLLQALGKIVPFRAAVKVLPWQLRLAFMHVVFCYAPNYRR